MALAATLVNERFNAGSVTSLVSSGWTPSSGDFLLAEITYREAVAGAPAPVASANTSHGGLVWTCVATIENGASPDTGLARFATLVTATTNSGTLRFDLSEACTRIRSTVTKVTGGAAMPTNTGVASSALGSPVVSLASILHDPDSLLIASIVSVGGVTNISPGAGWSELTQINSADDAAANDYQIQTRGPPPGTVYADWTGANSGGAGNMMIVSEIHTALATVNVVSVDDGLLFDDTDGRTHSKVFTDPVVF